MITIDLFGIKNGDRIAASIREDINTAGWCVGRFRQRCVEWASVTVGMIKIVGIIACYKCLTIHLLGIGCQNINLADNVLVSVKRENSSNQRCVIDS